LDRMDSQDINQMPVVDGGRLMGIVARDNILRFIRIHSELRI
jgi:CBS domain-containing protein